MFTGLIIIIGVICGYAGYLIGYGRGKTALEREILSHVAESPEYEDAVVETFRMAFNNIVRRNARDRN